MALPSSGPISALDIANEIGIPRTNFSWGSSESISLGFSTPNVPAPGSATISASNWYSKSWRIAVNLNVTAISTAEAQLNLNSVAPITGRSDVTYTLGRGLTLYALSTSTYALTTTGGVAHNSTYWKDTITINCAGGIIMGKGGAGGTQSRDPAIANGKAGGSAININSNVLVPVTINVTANGGNTGYICGGGGGAGASGDGFSVSVDSGGGGGGAGFGLGGGPNPVTTIPLPPPNFAPPQGDTPSNRKYSGGMGGAILPGNTVQNPVGSLYTESQSGGNGGQFVAAGSAYAGGLGGTINNAGPNTTYVGSGTRQGAAGGGGWGASGGNTTNIPFGNVTNPGGRGGYSIRQNGRGVTVVASTGRVYGDILL